MPRAYPRLGSSSSEPDDGPYPQQAFQYSHQVHATVPNPWALGVEATPTAPAFSPPRRSPPRDDIEAVDRVFGLSRARRTWERFALGQVTIFDIRSKKLKALCRWKRLFFRQLRARRQRRRAAAFLELSARWSGLNWGRTGVTPTNNFYLEKKAGRRLEEKEKEKDIRTEQKRVTCRGRLARVVFAAFRILGYVVFGSVRGAFNNKEFRNTAGQWARGVLLRNGFSAVAGAAVALVATDQLHRILDTAKEAAGASGLLTLLE